MAAIGIADEPETRPSEFLSRDPSITGRGSFRKKGGIIKPTVTVAVNNLADIDDIDTNTAVDILRRRYLKNIFYTYIGDVLIYMPPYSSQSMYGDDDIQYYCDNNAFDPDLKPHIYSFADRVYSNMLFWKRNQCVIMTGTSGAGKTINTKQFLSYLQSVSGGWEVSLTLKTRLAHLFNVLDCFGSAQTEDSIYASKYTSQLQLKFNYFGDIISCQLKTWLLEKSRVTGPPAGESNFHIFHLLMEHVGSDGSSYPYLKDTRHTFALKVTLEKIQESLVALGLAPEEKGHVINILTSILILGQIQFLEEDDGVGVYIPDQTKVKQVAKLLGIASSSLNDTLTLSPHISGSRKILMNPLTVNRAILKRDSLASYLYLRLCNEVLMCANESLAGEASKADLALTLDIVDGYGLKGGEMNNFATLCINYSNERLHQLFIQHVLTQPQELYLEEGLLWDPISIPDNTGVVSLFKEDVNCLMQCIENECNAPTQDKHIFRMEEAFKPIESPYFEILDELDDVFVIHHYVGEISYNAAQFSKMARTGLPKDCKRLLNSSKLPLLQRMFPDGAPTEWMKGKNSQCIAVGYLNAVDGLLADLKHKFISFVRCIKPNLSSTPQLFEDDIVEEQVASQCLPQTAQIKRRGFAFSSDLVSFVQRYKCTHEEDMYRRCDGDWAEAAERICGNLQLEVHLYFVGCTCIFIKDSGTVLFLEKKRDENIDKICTKIQLCWKRRHINKRLGPHLRAVRETLATADPTKKISLPKLVGAFSTEINDYLQRIYKTWWASKLIASLTEDQHYRIKIMITAHSCFMGEKSNNEGANTVKVEPLHFHPTTSPQLNRPSYFHSRTMSVESVISRKRPKKPSQRVSKPLNVNKLQCKGCYISSPVFSNKLPLLLSGQQHLLFAAPINRINKKHIVERGNILLTGEALIFLTSKYELLLNKTVLIEGTKGVSLSNMLDTMCVIHQKEHGKDMVLDFGVTGQYHTLAEFVAKLYTQCKDSGNAITVNVYKDRIKYNNSRKANVFHELAFSARKEKPLKANQPLCQLKNKVVVYYGGKDILH